MRFSADKSGIEFRHYTSKSVSYMHPPIASRDILSVAISQLCWINDDVVLYACGLGNFRELDSFLLLCAKINDRGDIQRFQHPPKDNVQYIACIAQVTQTQQISNKHSDSGASETKTGSKPLSTVSTETIHLAATDTYVSPSRLPASTPSAIATTRPMRLSSQE